MALNFSTTDKVSANQGLKILIYGAAGSGKTTFCGTAPSPIIISAEAGLLPLRNKSIPVIAVTSSQDAWDALTWVVANGKKHGIQTVCLDSFSEITEKILEEVFKKFKDPRQAYGEMNVQAVALAKLFRDMYGFHVIHTAKVTLSKDPLSGADKAIPETPGKRVGVALPYLYDFVFYAYTDKDSKGNAYHAVRTRASFTHEAKDRSGNLDEIEYPDATNIINKVTK